MPLNGTLDTAINGVVNGARTNGAAWMDVLRSNNDRMHRFNRLIIDEVERTQDERSLLVRDFLTRPTALSELTGELFQTLTRRSRRRMELARTMFDDLRDMTASTRSIYERMTDAGRQSLNSTARAGREAASEVLSEASDRAEDVSEAADSVVRGLRRQARRADPDNN